MIDLYYPALENWWCRYLAWLASTPRNSIEVELEPLRQDSNARIRIIDHIKRQEVGPYPYSDKKLWWMIICLDGAPERLGHQIQVTRSVTEAAKIVAPAEDRFRSLITDILVEPFERIVSDNYGEWPDGGYWPMRRSYEQLS